MMSCDDEYQVPSTKYGVVEPPFNPLKKNRRPKVLSTRYYVLGTFVLFHHSPLTTHSSYSYPTKGSWSFWSFLSEPELPLAGGRLASASSFSQIAISSRRAST